MPLDAFTLPRPTTYQAFGVSATFEAHIPMVTFRHKTGRCVSLPYFSLARADYDPSLQAVELAFGGAVVELLGRNLEPLFEALSRHAAVTVDEATAPEAALLPAAACVVERLAVRAE
jgi:hypothetical protein